MDFGLSFVISTATYVILTFGLLPICNYPTFNQRNLFHYCCIICWSSTVAQ